MEFQKVTISTTYLVPVGADYYEPRQSVLPWQDYALHDIEWCRSRESHDADVPYYYTHVEISEDISWGEIMSEEVARQYDDLDLWEDHLDFADTDEEG